eukprot:gene13610-16017_t
MVLQFLNTSGVTGNRTVKRAQQKLMNLLGTVSPTGDVGKKVLLLAALGGSAYSLIKFYKTQKESKTSSGLVVENIRDKNADKNRKKVTVDAVFFRRLAKIIRIIIPSVKSKEFLSLLFLTSLLFARTMLSVSIAEIAGKNAQNLVARQWAEMRKGVLKFALISIPASFVNSTLKYETDMLALRFRKRLSEHVHREYLEGVNFYKASHLGGANRIDNADQRVTSDIEQFCNSMSNLYTTVFKPVLDLLLFTQKLVGVMGWASPMMMFGYFILSGLLKRVIMPPFGRLTAKQSELEGNYRTVHQRLITNAEEIAFYDGIKGTNSKDSSELTKDYIRNTQLMVALAQAIGQLVLLGNKITNMAGYTSRVSELLEMVSQIKERGSSIFTIVQEDDVPANNTGSFIDRYETNDSDWLAEWKLRSDKLRLVKRAAGGPTMQAVSGGGRFIEGEFIKFEDVSIVSPEGKLLVTNLNFEVKNHQNVMITGPNGSGKSSLFRILGELWPLHNGTVIKPRKEDILFVPQKPYLVLGTLRDQIIYPHNADDMKRHGINDDDLQHLLATVDPNNTIIRQWAWDDVKDWFTALSGGQKQRIAMARLFYHRPQYAILDECTSAVSDEVEGKIYETCKTLGITLSEGHSFMSCVNFDYEEGRCTSYARNWRFQDRQGDAFLYQRGKFTKPMPTPLGPACGPAQRRLSPVTNQYSAKYPMGSFYPGQTICSQWPARNHALLPTAGQFEDDTQDVFFSHPISSKPFGNCTAYFENTNNATCTACYKLPMDVDSGLYVLQWFWEFNQQEYYMTCADVLIDKKQQRQLRDQREQQEILERAQWIPIQLADVEQPENDRETILLSDGVIHANYVDSSWGSRSWVSEVSMASRKSIELVPVNDGAFYIRCHTACSTLGSVKDIDGYAFWIKGPTNVVADLVVKFVDQSDNVMTLPLTTMPVTSSDWHRYYVRTADHLPESFDHVKGIIVAGYSPSELFNYNSYLQGSLNGSASGIGGGIVGAPSDYDALFRQVSMNNVQIPSTPPTDLAFIQNLIQQQQDMFHKRLEEQGIHLPDQQVQFLFFQEQQNLLKQILDVPVSNSIQLMKEQELKGASSSSHGISSFYDDEDDEMDEKGRYKTRSSQNTASRNYRQRKKDHISEVEQKVKELSLENERLRKENVTLKKGDMVDVMRPDTDFHQVLREVKTLLAQLQEAVNANDEKNIEYLLHLYYFSSQLRSTVIEREVEKIVHPYTQARLALMGYKSSAESSIFCGRPMTSAIWWPKFVEEVGLNDQQRRATDMLWGDHVKIHQALREERDKLDKEIKDIFLKKLVSCGGDVNMHNELLYQPITPNNQILQLASPITLTGQEATPTNQHSHHQHNHHYGTSPYPVRDNHNNKSTEVVSNIEPFDHKGPIDLSELLDLTRKLDQLKKNFVKNRNLICDTDLVLSTILSPVQHAKLILRLNSVSCYDIGIVDMITHVWGTIHSSDAANGGKSFVQALMPNENGRPTFLELTALQNQERKPVKLESLQSTYENLYKTIYNQPAPLHRLHHPVNKFLNLLNHQSPFHL